MNIRLPLFALLLCFSVFALLPIGSPLSATATETGTRLLRHPTVSRDSVAFEYAGDLWVGARGGGVEAARQ